MTTRHPADSPFPHECASLTKPSHLCSQPSGDLTLPASCLQTSSFASKTCFPAQPVLCCEAAPVSAWPFFPVSSSVPPDCLPEVWVWNWLVESSCCQMRFWLSFCPPGPRLPNHSGPWALMSWYNGGRKMAFFTIDDKVSQLAFS